MSHNVVGEPPWMCPMSEEEHKRDPKEQMERWHQQVRATHVLPEYAHRCPQCGKLVSELTKQ